MVDLRAAGFCKGDDDDRDHGLNVDAADSIITSYVDARRQKGKGQYKKRVDAKGGDEKREKLPNVYMEFCRVHRRTVQAAADKYLDPTGTYAVPSREVTMMLSQMWKLVPLEERSRYGRGV